MLWQGRISGVPLVDGDAQGDVTAYFECNDLRKQDTTLATIMNFIIADKTEKFSCEICHHEGYVDYIPSDIEPADMNAKLTLVVGREAVLCHTLKLFSKRHDYCLMDCMPSLGMMTIGAWSAATK